MRHNRHVTHFSMGYLRSKAGFSLVEVVLAIGVVSFALLSIFGLLPLGLATFHNSVEIYYSGETRQEILSGLQQIDLKTLLNGSLTYSETDYFDDEGSLIGKQANGGAMPAFSTPPVYKVVVTISTQTPTGLHITLPNTAVTPAANLVNAVAVTTQFSRYTGAAIGTSAGATTFRTGTDYLYYDFNETGTTGT